MLKISIIAILALILISIRPKRAKAMPQVFVAIGGVIAAAASAAASAASAIGGFLGGAGILGGLGGQLLGLAVTFGLQLVLGLINRPETESPSDSQRTTRNPVSYRKKIYGYGRYSGALISQRLRRNYEGPWGGGGGNNFLIFLIAICDGLTSQIDRFVIDGRLVDVDENLEATRTDSEGKKIIPPGYVRFKYRLGTNTQTVFTELTDAFPTVYDSDWKGLGVTLLLAMVRTNEKIYERLPNGKDTSFSIEGQYRPLWDPRDPAQDPDNDSTWLWTANAALVILNHLLSPLSENGFNIPRQFIDIESFKSAADISDVIVDAPGGGTRKQWELHGKVDYKEPASKALTAMLACCDGKLLPTSVGIGLSLGWEEPTVTLTDDDIYSFRRVEGEYLDDSGTVIKSQYTSPPHGYIEQDAIEYEHPDVSVKGRSITSIDYLWSQNHGQTRHLMKRAAYRINSPMTAILECGHKGMLCEGERFIIIKRTSRNIDDSFEITSNIEPVKNEEGYTVAYRFTVIMLNESDMSYSEAVDGVEPPPPPPDDDEAALIPDVPTIDVITRNELDTFGNVIQVVAEVTIDDTSVAYYHTVRYRESGTTNPWRLIELDAGVLVVEVAGLLDGREYDFQARARSASGDSDYSTVVTRNIVYDDTPPGLPTNGNLTGGSGEVDISARAPNSPSVVYIAIYRSLTSDFLDSSLVDNIGALQNTLVNYTDGSLAAGTYYYFLTAGNGSGIESAEYALGSVVVT